jgi:hypothetical protein
MLVPWHRRSMVVTAVCTASVPPSCLMACTCDAGSLTGPLTTRSSAGGAGHTTYNVRMIFFNTVFACQVRTVVARTIKIKAVDWRGPGVSVSVAVTLAPASSPVPMATIRLLEGRGAPPDGDAPVAMNTHYVNSAPVCQEVTAMTLSFGLWCGRGATCPLPLRPESGLALLVHRVEWRCCWWPSCGVMGAHGCVWTSGVACASVSLPSPPPNRSTWFTLGHGGCSPQVAVIVAVKRLPTWRGACSPRQAPGLRAIIRRGYSDHR